MCTPEVRGLLEGMFKVSCCFAHLRMPKVRGLVEGQEEVIIARLRSGGRVRAHPRYACSMH